MKACVQHETYYKVEKSGGFGTIVKSIGADESLEKMEKLFKILSKDDGFMPRLIEVKTTTIREETILKQ